MKSLKKNLLNVKRNGKKIFVDGILFTFLQPESPKIIVSINKKFFNAVKRNAIRRKFQAIFREIGGLGHIRGIVWISINRQLLVTSFQFFQDLAKKFYSQIKFIQPALL